MEDSIIPIMEGGAENAILRLKPFHEFQNFYKFLTFTVIQTNVWPSKWCRLKSNSVAEVFFSLDTYILDEYSKSLLHFVLHYCDSWFSSQSFRYIKEHGTAWITQHWQWASFAVNDWLQWWDTDVEYSCKYLIIDLWLCVLYRIP